jgi:hypothetical protein
MGYAIMPLYGNRVIAEQPIPARPKDLLSEF